MLSQYNPYLIEQALHDTPRVSPLPSAKDREAWQRLRERLGKVRTQDLIRAAERAAQQEIPTITATLFLDFKRSGERYPYDAPQGSRRNMLRDLALGECLEGKGRFLDPLLDVAWAICEESTWSRSGHQIELTDMARPHIDLMVATTVFELAELDLVLGDVLEPALSTRVRYEATRRCFVPYMERNDFHWMFNTDSRRVNNWNAVCNTGVVAAALHLEPDLARLARIIARALDSLDDYLEGFDPDGGTSEGSFCWMFGFGYFTLLADLLEHYTGGRISLWNERTKTIAQFPVGTQLSPHRFVNFSDCHLSFSHIPAHLAYLGKRLELPSLSAMAEQLPPNRSENRLPWSLRECLWLEPSPSPAPSSPAQHDWFGGLMWMVSRRDPATPDGLVLAAKGGHNGEMHNQNDVGNFIVHWRGESLVCDLGKGYISRAYFDHVGGRYGIFVNTSKAHSVPLMNQHEQPYSAQYAAELLEHTASERLDRLVLELRRAYPEEADLASLRRTLTLHRDTPLGWIELIDEVHFASGPGKLESALITLAEVTLEEASVTLHGTSGTLKVMFDPAACLPRVDVIEGVALEREASADVRRIVFNTHEPQQTATVRLRLEPQR